jgi:hypothetical protein
MGFQERRGETMDRFDWSERKGLSGTRHQRLCWALAAAFAGLGAGACMDAPEDAEETELGVVTGPILGGTVSWKHPEILGNGSAGGGCTDTLILPNVALTAAHCVGNGNIPPAGAGLDWFPEAGPPSTRLAVDRMFSFWMGWATIPYETKIGGVGDTDVAILRLQNPVPASQAIPRKISPLLPSTGQTVSAWGFGCDVISPRHGDGEKRYVTWDFGTAKSFCEGDSGGPHHLGASGTEGAVFGTTHTTGGAIGFSPWFKEGILSVVRYWSGATHDVGVDRPGSDLAGTLYTPSADSCRLACIKNASCRAYVWKTTSPNRCWLKRAIPDWVPCPTCISGTQLSYEQSTSRGAASYSTTDLPQARVELCKAMCARDPACKAYTYTEPGHPGPNAKCALKSTVSAWTLSAYNTSGVNRSMEANTDRPGGDYGSVGTSSAELCRAYCAVSFRCKAFSWVPSTGTCWLKALVPPPVSSASGVVSGVRGGLEYATDRPGDDLSDFEVLEPKLPEVCQAACLSEPACRSWTYTADENTLPNEAHCWLKSSIPAAITGPAQERKVSGVKGFEFF